MKNNNTFNVTVRFITTGLEMVRSAESFEDAQNLAEYFESTGDFEVVKLESNIDGVCRVFARTEIERIGKMWWEITNAA